MLLFSDASAEGWAAHLKELLTSGVWHQDDKHLHINILELKAAFLALQEFWDRVMGHSVVLMNDNTMIVAYVNKQGGSSIPPAPPVDDAGAQVGLAHSVELSARYIPGKRNVMADKLSLQNQVIGTEWPLHSEVTERLFDLWGRPVIDLFATQHNRKLQVFCSVMPDPWATAEDAF
ncbi:uncharacterized protein [Macrobrachium rosenbergii]|uniref:uncharacterized protein n=1 Tax=Macrobrachium rosenbergii TaxID=79674 RepID=UPI0034D716F9